MYNILFLRADDVRGFNALGEQKQKQKIIPFIIHVHHLIPQG